MALQTLIESSKVYGQQIKTIFLTKSIKFCVFIKNYWIVNCNIYDKQIILTKSIRCSVMASTVRSHRANQGSIPCIGVYF